VLVSGDLRRPRIGQFFGVDEAAGLTTILLGGQPLKQVLQQVDGYDRLWMLACGPVPPNPAELLSQRATHDIFDALREEFDLVLIDSPPVLPVTDAMVLSSYADGTLLVVAAGQTRRADLQRASEKFSQAKVPLLGIVLNEVTRQNAYGGQYGGVSGYGYASYVADTPAANGRPHANGESAAPTRHGRQRQ
jgi:capsular exopolysaccharide synthesis family protein